MSESHILLLPKEEYFKWVKACQRFVLAFGVTITPTPAKAGTKKNVTIANSPDGFNNIDVVKWLNDRFPNIVIDNIEINNPEELKQILEERVLTKKRYGDMPVVVDPTELEIALYWPTDYPIITQAFGVNPQNYAMWGLPGHEGLDFRAPWNTNIYACSDGEVFYVETRPDEHPYGKHIRIQHENGFRTVYAHLQEVLVDFGQDVVAKQLIGKADSTGNSTGSHLHLTLKKEGATARRETAFGGDVVDPTPYLVFPND